MSIEQAAILMKKIDDTISNSFNTTIKETGDNIQKPPLGACPYYIIAEDRIHELTAAIERSNALHNSESIKQWAKEIILQCDLIEKMNKN